MVLIHAIVFFELNSKTGKKTPLDYKVYTEGTNLIERKFIREFVEFGSKTLIQKMEMPDNEFIITIADGSFVIYITIIQDNPVSDCEQGVGCALLLSNAPARLDKLPHLVSKKLISDYISTNIVPETSNHIHQYFKHTELLDQLDETKKVLHRTLSKILERGEKIEDLVEKTEHLSDTSKIFFQHSRRLNSCWGCIPRPSWPPKWFSSSSTKDLKP